MTFGAVPGWLGWLILAAAGTLAVRLFLVKLRPPRMFIPSLLLWRRVLDDAREQTLWERIRRAVSLVVTVLIALALALAAVRPGRSAGGGQSTGRLLIVLDSSLSMEAATGRGETRWARAVAEARRLFASSSGAELALATTADGLVEGPTTDLALLESALDRLRPGGGDAAAWPRLAGASAVHFITDGAAARTIDAAVTVHTVFEPADNVGITALEVRPSLTPGTAGDAYLEVGNYAAAAQKVRLRVTRGGVEALDREFDMGPSEVMRQVIPVPQGGDAALQVVRRGAEECPRGRRHRVRLGRALAADCRHRRRRSHRVAARSLRARSRRARDVHGAGELDRRGRRGTNRPGHLRPLGPDRDACRASPALCASRGDALADRR